MSIDDYFGNVRRAESPDGRDNAAGSGAFGHFQFMPATAAAYANRTAWGKGATPATIKALVAGNPARERELMTLYTGDSNATLTRAGLKPTPANLFALHRFGPAGGVSLLNAPATMPVAEWVRSVNWGASPDAVISQNRLDRYANVGDIRNRFIAGQIGAVADGGAPTPEAPPVVEAQAAPTLMQRPGPVLAPTPDFTDALAEMFKGPDDREMRARREAERRRRLQLLFG